MVTASGFAASDDRGLLRCDFRVGGAQSPALSRGAICGARRQPGAVVLLLREAFGVARGGGAGVFVGRVSCASGGRVLQRGYGRRSAVRAVLFRSLRVLRADSRGGRAAAVAARCGSAALPARTLCERGRRLAAGADLSVRIRLP